MDEDKSQAKISGYLEKKGRLKMMMSYKKYWFVLEGRLLLYYRSKDEYEAISPCKGSINLGPPCTVKPCTSTVGVFQIETRTNTVTLRATNRDEQNRWMQAIMSALNQNQNAAKLSHFRYSLDDINKSETNLLQRKANVRKSLSSPSKGHSNNNTLIQKLQKMGAQSYGGSLGSICRIAANFGGTTSKSASVNSVNIDSSPQTTFRAGDNEQYSIIKSSSSGSVEFRKIFPTSQENLYERISNDLSSAGPTARQSLENVYSVPTKLSSESGGNTPTEMHQTNFLVDSNHYCGVDKIVTFPNTDAEVIYTEPKCFEKTDHNKNSVIVDNSFYKSSTDNVEAVEDPDYSIANFGEPANEVIIENAGYGSTNCRRSNPKNVLVENSDYITSQSNDIYEYLEVDYYEPSSPEKYEESSSQSSCGEKQKKIRFKSIRRKLGLMERTTKEEKPSKSLKKSQSFIKRVWKRKKHHDKPEEENEDDLYETVMDQEQREKLEMPAGSAVQMLSELQNILEHKKPILMKKLSNQLSTSFEEDELVLEHCPEVPAKTHKIKEHDAGPKRGGTVETVDKHLSTTTNPTKSIDEILEDLDNESGPTKMKKLIKKFSSDAVACGEDAVVFRKHDHAASSKPNRYSDELTRLLDELAKVTSAPIMTPGVTMSLINPNISDDELLKLIPIRKRRHSEPDYDVPRPHRSLMNLQKKEHSVGKPLPATRFFGSILPAPDVESSMKSCGQHELLGSMIPDSLEPDVHLSRTTPIIAPSSPGDDHLSYTSHNYDEQNRVSDNDTLNRRTRSLFCNNNNNNCHIYAHPKPIRSSLGNNHLTNKFRQDFKIDCIGDPVIYKNVRNFTDDAGDASKIQDVYVDSLEISSEISTSF